MKALIAAGGTAGHVIPALCVADQLKERDVEVEFVGGDRAEAELVPEAGYPFHEIRAEGFSRTNPLKAARALLLACGSLITSWRLLGRVKPDVVMGGGGYIAGPVGLAAVIRRIPLVLTEADSHLGITNRLLAHFAKRVCLAFPIEGRSSDRYLVTGRPAPRVTADRLLARSFWGIGEPEQVIVIFGGSLGARSINEAAIRAFEDGAYRVLHVAGKRDFASLVAPARDSYTMLEYLDHSKFGELLSAADLVISRSGGSVFELAAHGRPAILVPYPHATGDHQTENARWMERAGAAAMITDERLTPSTLRTTVDEIFSAPERLKAMSEASLALASPDASRDVAAQVRAACE